MGLMTMGAANAQAQGGYSSGGRSPVGIGGAVAVHAVVVGAFLLMPREVITPYVPQILIGKQIPLDPPPPPEKTARPPESRVPSRLVPDPRPTATDPLVILPGTGSDVIGGELTGTGSGAGDIIVPPLDPPHEPLLIEPSIDPRALSAFQPDYPGSMVRQGVEGSVTVRVTIAADGHVTDIERITASDDAFWAATQRHALRKWRFRPATRGGEAVAGSKVLTVHFRLTDR